MSMKRNAVIRTLTLIGALAMCLMSFGCKPEDEITPAPTAKPEAPDVIVTNQQLPQEHFIEVNGYGEVFTAPDFATVIIGVQSVSETAEEATTLCEELTRDVRQLALQQDVKYTDISIKGITLGTKLRENDGAIVGYVATDTITIVVWKVPSVNTLLSSIIDAGITESYSVTYSLTDASAAYQRALIDAMADALTKAQTVAEAGDVTIGKVIGVTELPTGDELVGVAFESSSIAVSAHVAVQYLIP